MRENLKPLKFPDHFPPTSAWKKFFIGIWWFGPDISFFKDLKAQQAARDGELMSVWGDGSRQLVAERIAHSFHQRLGWPTAIFLPEDSFLLICTGPKYRMIDDLAVWDVIRDIERLLDIKIPTSFWSIPKEVTFGEVIDTLLTRSASSLAVERTKVVSLRSSRALNRSFLTAL